MDLPAAASSDPLIARALALLHADPAQPWTLATIATAVGASRSSLVVRFTASVGCPPMRYLTCCRMRLASQRLRDGSVKIAAVAQAVGYGSEAAFSRAFKRVLGQPPRQWRRQSSARLLVGCPEFEPDEHAKHNDSRRKHDRESTGVQ